MKNNIITRITVIQRKDLKILDKYSSMCCNNRGCFQVNNQRVAPISICYCGKPLDLEVYVLKL